MSHNLIIDIGNTFAKILIFKKDQIIFSTELPNNKLDHFFSSVSAYKCKKGIFSSVVDLPEKTLDYLKNLPVELTCLNSTTPLPIKNAYKTPKTLGSDRIAAAVGANFLYPNQDILIIDIGTCITYDFIDQTNTYLGGNISPGIRLRFQALNTYTSKLPLIALEGDKPELGYNTETAIRSGVVKGIQHEINNFIDSLKNKKANLFVFLTGGDAIYFENQIKNPIFANKFLVPIGLNRILKYNED